MNDERECCVVCASCGRVFCQETWVSPGEASGICPACWSLEDGDAA